MTCQQKNEYMLKKSKGGDNMAKYLMKLTKFKNRYSITLPIALVKSRDLKKYEYMIIKDSGSRPLTLKGFNVNDNKI